MSNYFMKTQNTSNKTAALQAEIGIRNGCNVEIVKQLLFDGANVNAKLNDNSLLMFAIIHRSKSAKILLMAGADVHHLNQNNNDALDISIKYNKSFAQLILKSGYQINPELSNYERQLKLNRKLKLAAYFHPKIMKSLIKLGADVNYSDTNGNIFSVIIKNNPHYVPVLINHGLNINSSSQFGIPLLVAIQSKQFKAAKKLVDAGADVNLKNNLGFDATYIAAIHMPEIIPYLFNHGAKLYHTLEIFQQSIGRGEGTQNNKDAVAIMEILISKEEIISSLTSIKKCKIKTL